MKKALDLFFTRFKKTSALFAGVFFVFFAYFSASIFSSTIETQKNMVAPPDDLAHFVFGYNEVIADMMWVRSLQDFDYCENKVDEINCVGNSWVYRMINTIVTLSPHFREAYASGALALTVMVNDIEGASKIFDKAVAAFPNDWTILYRAAYQALIEEKDNEKAAALMLRAAQNGAPEWLYQASARLYSEEGKIVVAEGILADLKRNNGNADIIKTIEKRIEDLKNGVAKSPNDNSSKVKNKISE